MSDRTLHVGLAIMAAALLAGCALPTDVGGGGSALVGGDRDLGADAREQEELDAAVLLGDPARRDGGCIGVLITPRVILTAWHCVGDLSMSRPRANFGQSFPATPALNVATVACEPFPGARDDGVTPTCRDAPFDVARRLVLPGFRAPFDLAVVVLDQRVDAANRVDGPRARPMAVATEDPGGSPSGWRGELVRLVGQGYPIGTRGPVQRVTTSPRAILGLDGVDDSHFLMAHDPPPGGVGGDVGDSGGPWIWQPPGEPPRVVSVFNQDPRLTHPEVREWLRALVSPSAPGEGFIGRVFVGPSDVPSTDNAEETRTAAHALLDPDGDGLVGAHDNCLEVANVEQHDANLDGVGDACDRDSDGVADGDDNCADDFNPDQEDCDEDEIGDACETDSDLDGIPDECDDCDAVFNRVQGLDCNADAVAALNRGRAELGMDPVPVRGDACDPIPCGDTRLLDDSVARPTGTRFTMDRVEVDARAETPAAFPLAARTVFRFCQCRIGLLQDTNGDDVDDVFIQTEVVGDDPRSRESCELDDNGGCSLNAIGNIQDPTDPGAAVELATWRWTTHRGLDPVADGMPRCPVPNVPRGPFCVDSGRTALAPEYPTTYARYRDGDGFVADRYGRWLLHEEDVPRWTAAGVGDPLRDTIGVGPGLRGAVSGVLWTHTPGPSAAPSPDYPFFATPLVREQASHYWSGRALAPFDVPRPEPCFVPFLPFLGTDLSCPFCPYRFPQPAIGFRALAGCLPDLRFPGLFVGNARIDPGDALDLPGLELFAGDAGPWLAVSEPGAWLPRDGLRYVKLTSGVQIDRVIVERAGVFEDPQACAPGQCNPMPATFLATEALPLPEPRRGGASVVSALRGELWVIGGESTADGRALDEVWAYEIASGAWELLPPGARPILGQVHAATYSPADDALWVLDEVPPDPRERGGQSRARLLRLDPTVGSGEVVAHWPRSPRPAYDRFTIAADEAGLLYVVGWRDGAAHHVVVRLRATSGRADALGWSMASGEPIASTVRATDRGLGVYVRRGARVDAVGHSARELRPGGADRCF